jgi:hypothetical protein
MYPSLFIDGFEKLDVQILLFVHTGCLQKC